MFVDTGLPLLLKELAGFRALRSRMVFALVGGASLRLPDANRTFFRIGEDNIAAARGFFKEQNLKLVFEDVGGYVNRTMHFHIGNGLLSIKKPSGTSEVQFG